MPDPSAPPAPVAPPVATPPGSPPANPPGTPPSPPSFYIKPDGSYIENFWEHPAFPADLKENLQLRTHKTLADTYKNWATLEKMRGASVVPIPGANAEPAVWDAVWSRLGYPGGPDKYEIPSAAEAGLQQDQMADPATIKAFVGAVDKARLTSGQFKTLLTEWNKYVAQQVKDHAATAKTALDTLWKPLRDKWAAATDGNTALATNFLRSHLAPDAFTRLEKAGVLQDPGVVELAHRLHEQLKEGNPDLAGGGPIAADVAAAAEAELNKLITDLRGAYHDRYNPGHKAAVEKANQLREIVLKARKGKSP